MANNINSLEVGSDLNGASYMFTKFSQKAYTCPKDGTVICYFNVPLNYSYCNFYKNGTRITPRNQIGVGVGYYEFVSTFGKIDVKKGDVISMRTITHDYAVVGLIYMD